MGTLRRRSIGALLALQPVAFSLQLSNIAMQQSLGFAAEIDEIGADYRLHAQVWFGGLTFAHDDQVHFGDAETAQGDAARIELVPDRDVDAVGDHQTRPSNRQVIQLGVDGGAIPMAQRT